jgi:cytochrome c-type biogenesis protein CcmH/NrfG
VKLRYAVLFLASLALIATGCGSDSKDSDKKGDSKPQTKAQKAAAKDRDNKEDAVARAKKDFEKNKDDVGACRNLAMSYIAIASPASAPDPKTAVELPKDRDKSLAKAVKTLEGCAKTDPKDRDVKQMLASTYMATSKYDKAAPLLKQLAGSAKGQERANAYYAWGLAASNAQDFDAAIEAWQKFIELSPAKDPRIAQVQQSIKALRAAKAAPKTTTPTAEPSTTTTESSDDAAKDDEG